VRFQKMFSYLIAFSWGICILLSFIGYGRIINRLFFPNQQIDWGQRAAWGLAFSVFVGGILNAAWMISRTTLLIYLGVGFVYCIVDFINNRQLIIPSISQLFQECRKDRLVLAGVVLVSLLIFVQYGGWVSLGRLNFANMVYADGFNTSDDYHAYLVFPHKMLQLGSMGPDPFSERRMTSLGGQSFLHTFIISVLSDTNLNIIDPGLALLIIIGLIVGYCQHHQVSTRRTLFLLLFLVLITAPKANTTSLMLPVALLLSLFRTMDSEEMRHSHFTANALIIALTSAAICALKSSLIPVIVICFCLSYSFYFLSSHTKIKVASEFILATALVGLFLMPWMISSYQSSGTLLYPLLGKGDHASAYGITFKESSTVWETLKTAMNSLRGIYIFILVFLGCISVSVQPPKLFSSPDGSSFASRQASLSMTISAVLATSAIGIATENADPFRYSFSHLFTAIVILVMIAMIDKEGVNKKAATNFFIVAVFCVGVIMSDGWDLTKSTYSAYLKNIRFGLSNPSLVSDQQMSKYAAIQQSIPKESIVLTRLDFPFTLDFKRNQIFLADWPGGASLPPGMPVFQGPEALANYLVSKSIRYIAYSATSLNHPEVSTSGAEFSSWFRLQTKLAHDFRDSVKQLANTRKLIYEDGENFVLDLQSKVN
jgi:hypothetical protein